MPLWHLAQERGRCGMCNIRFEKYPLFPQEVHGHPVSVFPENPKI
jgi:hypothetical protein